MMEPEQMAGEPIDNLDPVAESEIVGDGPPIPGLRLRTYRGPSDVASLVAVCNAAERADETNELTDIESLANRYANLDDFDARRDVLVAQVDRRVVAFSEQVRTVHDGTPVFGSYGYVVPEWRRRGLGRTMLRMAETNARARADAELTTTPAQLGSWSTENVSGNIALLESEGYTVARWFFEMERPDLEAIPPAPLPPDLELRPVPEERRRDVLLATFEAFRDHWGSHEPTDTDLRRILGDPATDPSLWQVAWAGNEVAGAVLPAVRPAENLAMGVERGWLDTVSVRRPWRRRGVAHALIAAALRELRRRGMHRAALGVDAHNPNGALGLYEGLGFRTIKRAMAYRKPI